MRKLRGIDVSNWNSGLDYTTLAKQIDFVIPQCSYGTTKNPLFQTHVNGFRAVKTSIPAVYHFIYAVNEAQAKANALKAIQCVEEAGLPKSTVIYADFEYDTVDSAKSHGVILGPAECDSFTKIFCETVKEAGYPTGIYSNIDYCENMYSQDLLKQYPLWLCDLSGSCKYPCTIWQYSWEGTFDGHAGKFDVNYWYVSEDGDLTDGSELLDANEPETVDEAIERVLTIARAEIGYHEKATPYKLDDASANAGSANYTKYGRTMHAVQPSNMDYPAAWCDCFVDWCFYTAFGEDLAREALCGDFDDYTVNSANLYKRAARWTYTGKKGYQIFFKNSTGICHTGIVTEVRGGKVYTIEGNSGNQVRAKVYNIYDSSIAGYGCPKYDVVVNKIGGMYMFSVATVKKGSTGNDVLLLQRLLIADGYTGFEGKALAPDGDFGGNTDKAVKEYQSKHDGLAVDGICGPATWRALLGV